MLLLFIRVRLYKMLLSKVVFDFIGLRLTFRPLGLQWKKFNLSF